MGVDKQNRIARLHRRLDVLSRLRVKQDNDALFVFLIECITEDAQSELLQLDPPPPPAPPGPPKYQVTHYQTVGMTFVGQSSDQPLFCTVCYGPGPRIGSYLSLSVERIEPQSFYVEPSIQISISPLCSECQRELEQAMMERSPADRADYLQKRGLMRDYYSPSYGGLGASPCP